MAATNNASVDFRFGTEIEFVVLGLKGEKGKPLEKRIQYKPNEFYGKSADDLKRELVHAKLKVDIVSKDAEDKKYDKWLITWEHKLHVKKPGETELEGVAMELISPVCRFADIDDYKDQLITAWRVLDENFEIETNHNCGTHIHVSPVESGEGGGKFTVHQATTMAKAIVYYERCLDSLMGPERLANFFCKSNRHNVQLREKDIKEVFEEIETIANNAAENTVFGNYVFMKLLFDLVCSQAKVEENRYRGGDYFRWNLKHLQRNKIGTIEFRQPPASDSWSHAYQWVVLLKAYVSGAMIEEYDLDNQPEPSMETFKKFIFKGAKASGIEEYSNQDNYLRQSFEKAVKLPEPEFDLMPLDPVRLDEPAKAAMNKLNELLNNKREKLQNDHPDKIITLDYVKERYGYC